MTRPFASTCLVLLCSLAASAPIAARAYTGQGSGKGHACAGAHDRLEGYARPITDQELEREPARSGLRYSFEGKRGAKTFEVGVDSKTGAVLEHKIEGPNPD